ncbi:MAG: M28 family peptidase [Phycisphaeraceae bacterium]|nr:M28 family peptidase [Phycisphaeraceae bacterium]
MIAVLASACMLGGVLPPIDIKADRLLETIRSLPERRSPGPDEEHLRGLRATERLIERSLHDLGYTVHSQDIPWNHPVELPEGDPDDGPWKNLWVEITGSDLPDEVVIVGAHFDAVPNCPGADDNGSGTAALLALAREYAGRAPRRTIHLVFFNLEEIGLIGSTLYATERIVPLRERGADIVGMMSLEMLGYYSDRPRSQRSPIPRIPGVFEPRSVGDFIAMLGLRGGATFHVPLSEAMRRAEPELRVEVVDFLVEPMPDFRRSDNAPFWDIDVPAVMLTDTSNYRNPNYHRPADTVETLDAARYARTVRAVAAGIWEIANPPASAPATP